ncbi:MAG: aminodeoxychorismate/anthranilate synthase component II [Planctomycetota bacterium]|nr:aminodeoxychorismate/anthranilate synthase component II [Planctomycetota bacterium]
MILIIDNYDSFTYNLVQRLGEMDQSLEMKVFRNDAEIPESVFSRTSHLLISPGPCTPNEAGRSLECIARFAGQIPVLGICLGHQSIGQVFGGEIVLAKQLMHGKTDQIHHDGTSLFSGLPNPLVATRYHSLAIRESSLSADFRVCAWANNPDGSREIMAICHREQLTFGWQFHPESFLTEQGPELLKRFIETSY